ncbi:ABC transporter substrate-binding protein [Streptosporangiaceae bacterium NEAU-GS5]|nr:ABC transporter substrate-binding protein [Streptosporangiaceae bacterium NEAU-GS5]
MEILVLGPVEIRHGMLATRITTPKLCALLACLLAHPNAAVSVDRLVDALWPVAPPRSAADNLRAYVAQLRRMMDDASRIAAATRGYALTVVPDEVDAARFERLLRMARTASPRERAAEAYGQALALWRGDAFGGVELGGVAREYAIRLDEERLAAVEEGFDAELAMGRHKTLVGRLRGLVEEHPMRERLWAQLMLALYHSGRQAEALSAYQDARTRLVEELGLEPGPELRALQRDILTASPALRLSSGSRVRLTPPSRARLAAALGFAATLLLVTVVPAATARQERSTARPPAAAVAPADELTIGALLPTTDTCIYGPAAIAGMRVAVQEINAAGGVLGRPVRLVGGGDVPEFDEAAVRDLLSQDVDVIVDACDEGPLEMLDQAVPAGILMISPSNTGRYFTTDDDRGLFFRLAGTDALEGRALARLVEQAGHRKVAVVYSYVDDGDIGAGLRAGLDRSRAKIARWFRVTSEVNFADIARDLSRLDPDAVVFIGNDDDVEGMIEELPAYGWSMRHKKWYFADTAVFDYYDALPRGALAKVKAISPHTHPPDWLRERMSQIDSSLDTDYYGAEAYDAVVLAALAAEAAHDDSGLLAAAQLTGVSREGRVCTTFVVCRDLLRRGADVDYNGVSGPIDFDDAGDVQEATFTVSRFDDANTVWFDRTFRIKAG